MARRRLPGERERFSACDSAAILSYHETTGFFQSQRGSGAFCRQCRPFLRDHSGAVHDAITLYCLGVDRRAGCLRPVALAAATRRAHSANRLPGGTDSPALVHAGPVGFVAGERSRTLCSTRSERSRRSRGRSSVPDTLFVQTESGGAARHRRRDGPDALGRSQVGRRGHPSLSPGANENFVAVVNGSYLYVAQPCQRKAALEDPVGGGPRGRRRIEREAGVRAHGGRAGGVVPAGADEGPAGRARLDPRPRKT